MANTVASPNMSLPVPVVGVDVGPTWALDLNTCLSLLDSHDHSPGNGVAVTSAGININANLPLNSNNLISARSLRMVPQASLIASTSPDIAALYVSTAGELYYNDISGNQVKITNAGGVAGTSGSIANLGSGGSSATFVLLSSTFVFQSAAATPGNMDVAAVILRNLTASSKGLTLSPPAAMGADYSLTLPSLPGANNTILTISTSGDIAATVVTDNSTLEISSNTLRIKDLGVTAAKIANTTITAAKIANGTITGTQVVSSINLPGSSVQENGKNVVVSNTNASNNSMCLIRGSIDAAGNPVYGEGYTSSRASAGIYNIFYSAAVLDTPTALITPIPASGGPYFTQVNVIDVTHVTLNTYLGGVLTDVPFGFLIIGQRV